MTTDTLNHLIARHRSAFSAHLAALRLADLRHDDQLREAADRIADEEQAAALAIFRHPCVTLDEVRAKARYLADSELVYELGEGDNARVLLASLVAAEAAR